MASPNVSGQAYAFMAMTPVMPGEEQPLAEYLRGLRARGPSPLARLARTHLARFVIVPDFKNDPTWKQRHEEHLDLNYLIFTSNLDGDLDSYLDELCEKLAPEAKEIWGRCVGCPESAEGAALKTYLRHNQIDTGIFFAAYGEATVATVRKALREREKMIAFAIRAQGMAPAALHEAFLAEFIGAQ
ncbi:MAG: hypothetical protein AVDCRST_MAG67-3362 [uncultured Solirubrobacteraceae bacterium]|uniref:Uncharacterized protein n=1 Tax=uncultured Solirubrobacteraceae bacterium TaxID=1162706 RepID=A0A6J4TFQ3_9ACTN|nr:MAG: hypothetical protein AVDCRST_MAG67-3362 [uncultured Solirubrobacteraceae bacterium]